MFVFKKKGCNQLTLFQDVPLTTFSTFALDRTFIIKHAHSLVQWNFKVILATVFSSTCFTGKDSWSLMLYSQQRLALHPAWEL